MLHSVHGLNPVKRTPTIAISIRSPSVRLAARNGAIERARPVEPGGLGGGDISRDVACVRWESSRWESGEVRPVSATPWAAGP